MQRQLLPPDRSSNNGGDAGTGGDELDFDYSFDPTAVLQRKFSMVAPPPISRAVELEQGMLAQRRRKQAMERKQYMRSNLFGTGIYQGAIRRHHSNTNAALGEEVAAQLRAQTVKRSPSDASATTVPEAPGFYQIKEVGESQPFTARVNHTIINYRGCLYMFGGRNGVSSGAQYVTGVWMYLASRQQWTELEEKSGTTGISSSGAKTTDGGSGTSGGAKAASEGNTAPNPGRRGDHSAVVVGDDMFIYGGRRQLVSLDDMYAYSFSTNTWRLIQFEHLAGPGPLFNHVSCYSADSQRLYIIGGVSAVPRTSCVFAWDVKYSYWRRILLPADVNPNDLHRVAAVCRHKKLYVYGCRSETSDEPIIHCLDESTGLWSEVSALGHPPHSIGVLWNLVPPVYLPELAMWLFPCSFAAASTPTAGHVHGTAIIAPSQAAAASSTIGASQSQRGSTSRKLRVPSVSVRASPDLDSSQSSPRRPSKLTSSGGTGEPSSSLLGTAKASVIAQMPASQRESAVWLMAYQFHTSTWSKMTIHSGPAVAISVVQPSGPNSSAGAVFTRLLVPNTSAFERKYVAVPFGNDPAGFVVCGGVSEQDRVFARMLPKKGLPPSLVSLGASGGGGGAVPFLSGGTSGRKSTFSPAVALDSKRLSSLKSGRHASRLMSGSLVFGDASTSTAGAGGGGAWRASGSNESSAVALLDSPSKASAASGRRSTIGASLRGAAPPSLSRHVGGASGTGQAVMVVPFAPGYALPWESLDPSGCPVVNLTPEEVLKWQEAYYASECRWVAAEKARIDAEDAAEARRLAKLRRRQAKDSEAQHGYAATTATTAIKDAERARDQFNQALAAAQPSANASTAEAVRMTREQRMRKAAYAHMGVPVLRQRDVALNRTQRSDRRLRALLRWELVRRYVLSGEASADARARNAATAASPAAASKRNPLVVMDTALWPPSNEDDDVMSATAGLSDMVAHFRPNRQQQQQHRRDGCVVATARSAYDRRRAFGSAEAVVTARNGLHLTIDTTATSLRASATARGGDGGLRPKPPQHPLGAFEATPGGSSPSRGGRSGQPFTERTGDGGGGGGGNNVTMSSLLTGGVPPTLSVTMRGLGHKAPRYVMPTMERPLVGSHEASSNV